MMARLPRPYLGAALAVLVAGAVIGGLYLAGSPAEARLRRLDERRVDDLVVTHYAIEAYWKGRGSLPASLDSLPVRSEDTPGFLDPVSGRAYPYAITGDSTYDLCADFARASNTRRYGPAYDGWQHPRGQHCFHLTASHRPTLDLTH